MLFFGGLPEADFGLLVGTVVIGVFLGVFVVPIVRAVFIARSVKSVFNIGINIAVLAIIVVSGASTIGQWMRALPTDFGQTLLDGSSTTASRWR